MVITLRKIVAAIPALGKLASCDLRLKTAYHLRKSISVLQKEADFFGEERLKIIKRNGTIEADNSVSFEPGKKEIAERELAELLDMEVTPDADRLEIPLTENVQLSVGDIEVLEPFIEFVDVE